VVTLALDLSGRILPAMSVWAMGWRCDPAPDRGCFASLGFLAGVSQSVSVVSLRLESLTVPVRVDLGKSLTRWMFLAPLTLKSSHPSTWGPERRGPSVGDTAEIVELAGFVLAGRQGFGLGAARRQPNRGLTIERAAEQP
jgi:hypothetical protein